MPSMEQNFAIFTIDVETPYPDGELGVYEFLKIFESENIKATFFVTGDVAENNPAVVKAIIESDHEVGSHGWRHPYISVLPYDRPPFLNEIDDDRLDKEIHSSYMILEDLGASVEGFRAMQFLTSPRVSNIVAKYFDYESSYSDRRLKKSHKPIKPLQLPVGTLRYTSVHFGTPLLFGPPFKFLLSNSWALTNSRPLTIYSHSSDFVECKVPLYTKRWKQLWYYDRCGPSRKKDVTEIIRGIKKRGFQFITAQSWISQNKVKK